MARAPDRSISLDPEPATAALRRTRRPPARRPRRPLPGWCWLITGLLIGWLLIGWLLWPVQWTNSQPWDLSPAYQQTYVQLVADRYSYDQNLGLAEDALRGWDRAAVNELLVQMQSTAPDAAARRRLAQLAAALSLPGGDQSLASIFSQGGVWLALALAVLPIIVAVSLILLARLRPPAPPAASDELSTDAEAGLEELLADLQLDAENGPAAEPDAPSNPVNPENPQPPPEEEEPEQTQDPNNMLGDLASLFEEEDTSLIVLETLCKGMPDIAVEDLLRQGREVMRRFREERPRRDSERT